MVDEDHIARVRISRRPWGQVAVKQILGGMYRFRKRTTISVSGLENIPLDRGVIFALNHTDRYNYWPFQYYLSHIGHPRFTLTWVKAKYYESRAMSWFLDQCNNLPLPSRGYVILKDAQQLLGRKLEHAEYRVLRDCADRNVDPSEAMATAGESIQKIMSTPRRDFVPQQEAYADFIERWCDRLMGLVEKRSLEAIFEKENHILVFPQGTRSIRLLPGRTGLVEFALRYEIPVVPVGSNGSEKIYPDGNPWARGGKVEYRIGQPLTVDDAFSECKITQSYRPFTRDGDAFSDRFERASWIVTNAINELLDEPYRLDESEMQQGKSVGRLL